MKSGFRLIYIGLFCLMIWGCDLFQTRPTELPNQGGSAWQYPLSVDQVFSNFTQAIVELNSDHYMRSFFSADDSTHDYLFIPNPNYAGWPISDPWGYIQEQETIQRLFALIPSGESGFLTLYEEGRLIYPNEDSARVSQTYTLVMPVMDPTLPPEVSGRADFYLAKNTTGYWAIYRWEDLEGSPSWTDLKAGLY